MSTKGKKVLQIQTSNPSTKQKLGVETKETKKEKKGMETGIKAPKKMISTQNTRNNINYIQIHESSTTKNQKQISNSYKGPTST